MKTEWPYTFKLNWSTLRYPAGSRKKRKKFHEDLAVALDISLSTAKHICQMVTARTKKSTTRITYYPMRVPHE